MPVKTDNITDHKMHAEFFEIKLATLLQLIVIAEQKELNTNTYTPVIAVGTTSLRCLESLYWLGIKLIQNQENINSKEVYLLQWEAYAEWENSISVKEALTALAIDPLKYDADRAYEALVAVKA
jgi:S-adenosylmethionine:tRNA ribosyltransferase-isomerase